MRNQWGGTRADTMVKMALIFFISLFSFSVGTFVGKQVSDSERKKAQLEEDYGKFRGTASVNTENLDVDPKKALTDADIQGLTDEFVNSEKEKSGEHGEHNDHAPAKNDNHNVTATSHDHGHGKKTVTADGYTKIDKSSDGHAKSAEAHSAHGKTKQESEMHNAHGGKPSTASARVADAHSPSHDMPEARKPASVLPSVASSTIGKYTVQLASYPSETEAKTQAEKLKAHGMPAFYIKAIAKGGTWYRVSAGLFDTKDEANDYRSKAMADSGVKSAIVQKILPE